MDKIKQFITAKNIFILAGVVIFIEVIWAAWALMRPSSAPASVKTLVSTIQQVSQPTVSSAVLTLKADKTSLKVGDKFTVAVNVSSDVKAVGIDLVIKYDPKLLTVQSTKAGPLKSGVIFSDYPQNQLNTKTGEIIVSGISDANGGVLATGLFGSVDFVAKAAGTAQISLDFTKGSTTDSNVIDVATTKDVLQSVENTQIDILP